MQIDGRIIPDPKFKLGESVLVKGEEPIEMVILGIELEEAPDASMTWWYGVKSIKASFGTPLFWIPDGGLSKF